MRNVILVLVILGIGACKSDAPKQEPKPRNKAPAEESDPATEADKSFTLNPIKRMRQQKTQEAIDQLDKTYKAAQQYYAQPDATSPPPGEPALEENDDPAQWEKLDFKAEEDTYFQYQFEPAGTPPPANPVE